jgi:hypothetical protein
LRRHGAWLATFCLGVYYAFSASRDLSLYDSGELALAAVQLGLGHPPGQPLHTLLGHVLSRVTAGAPLWGVNLLSALPGALTLLPAARISEQLSAGVPERMRLAVPWLLLLFALHESLWEPASRVEVYTLATLLALSAIAHALPLLTQEREASELLRRTTRAALLLGLCACSNPVIAVAAGLALAPGLIAAAVRARAVIVTLGVAAVGGVIGLLPYAYLPLVAARDDVMIWGGLSDWPSYVRYLTMRDYARNQTLGFWEWLAHAGAWGAWSVEHLLAPVLIIGLGGFFAARARLRFAVSLFVCASAVLIALVASNVGWNLEVPDYNGYMACTYWLAAAGATALFVRCRWQRQHFACAAIALCLAAGFLSPPVPAARTRASDRLARTLAERVLEEAPRGAILVTFADYFAGTLFYLQEVEKQRPDVVVLAYGLTASSWHWRRLFALHPDLKPIDFSKRGNRLFRVRDWLKDNASRPILLELFGLAGVLDLRVCEGGVYFRTGWLCDTPSARTSATAQLLSDQLTLLGEGSPAAMGAIAEISENLGSGLWRLGLPEAAHAMLMAGVPHTAWPAKIADTEQLVNAQQFVALTPRWARKVALGDPARNLFLAGAIAARSGQTEAALSYVRAAANLRLPEAEQLLHKP